MMLLQSNPFVLPLVETEEAPGAGPPRVVRRYSHTTLFENPMDVREGVPRLDEGIDGLDVRFSWPVSAAVLIGADAHVHPHIDVPERLHVAFKRLDLQHLRAPPHAR